MLESLAKSLNCSLSIDSDVITITNKHGKILKITNYDNCYYLATVLKICGILNIFSDSLLDLDFHTFYMRLVFKCNDYNITLVNQMDDGCEIDFEMICYDTSSKINFTNESILIKRQINKNILINIKSLSSDLINKFINYSFEDCINEYISSSRYMAYLQKHKHLIEGTSIEKHNDQYFIVARYDNRIKNLFKLLGQYDMKLGCNVVRFERILRMLNEKNLDVNCLEYYEKISTEYENNYMISQNKSKFNTCIKQLSECNWSQYLTRKRMEKEAQIEKENQMTIQLLKKIHEEKIAQQVNDNQMMIELLKKIKKDNGLANIFADIWVYDNYDTFAEKHCNLKNNYLKLAQVLYKMDSKTREFLFFNKEF